MSPITSLKIFWIGCGVLSVVLTLISRSRITGFFRLFIFWFACMPILIGMTFDVIHAMSKRAIAQATIGQLEWKSAFFALIPWAVMAILALVAMRLGKTGLPGTVQK